MLKRLFHIIILLVVVCNAFSQLSPLLDQYHLNGLAINPAYAGSQGALSVGIHSRIQWVGFEGSPRTSTFTIHSPMRNKKVNLGLIVLGDRLGSKKETGFLLNYAYRIELGQGKLSLGMAAGLTSLSADINSIKYTDQGDILLQDLSQRSLFPEFSLGSYYQTKHYYVGISMPLFLSHPYIEGSSGQKIGFRPASANYIISAGALFRLSETIELLPSMLLRTNPANSTQLDLHCNVIYKEKLWLGASIRTNGNLSTLLQLQINPQLRVGYSYGYELSMLSSYQHGSHELVISYSFRYILNVMSPRYF